MLQPVQDAPVPVGEVAVVDDVDAVVQRQEDVPGAPAVRRDSPPPRVRLLAGSADLFRGVRCQDVVLLLCHQARGHQVAPNVDLDRIHSFPDAEAHLLADLVRTIGNEAEGVPVLVHGREVSEAARRADLRRSCQQAWSGRPACVDPVPSNDVQARPCRRGAECAREPGLEQPAAVQHRGERALLRGQVAGVRALHDSLKTCMRVPLNEAGDDSAASAVDDVATSGDIFGLCSWQHRLHRVAF
mmetsp:Transcript_106985/g.319961  ORF Transcript_106985/g.319961 Transcript_106985/m.319961 type:complete len:243 (-) Transcript_106985:128-856(-)